MAGTNNNVNDKNGNYYSLMAKDVSKFKPVEIEKGLIKQSVTCNKSAQF